MLNEELRRCRVCGLLLEEPPWGDDGQSPTYDFCPCCGVEFGYGDATPQAARQWRHTWITAGATWREPERRPADWSLDQQLKDVPPGFD